MKELTTEQKAQRYDEALELAAKFRKEYLNYKELNVHKGVIEAFNSIFPELKESEDERIRKAIIEFFELQDGNTTYSFIPKKDILAWLEKIGKNTTNKGEPNLLTHERVMEISPFMRSGFENEDKVEPKFHKEDWVVWDNKISCHVDNIYQGKNSLMYTITDTNNMTRSYSVKGFDNNAHLWTINDAKDGDVLVSESTCGLGAWYCIFKSLDGDESMTVYCYLARDGRFETKKELCFDKDPYNTNPATKEQREQLEKAMADAGYTFDFEKKELKKIEQNPAWSEEDDYNLQCMIAKVTSDIQKGNIGRNNELIDWLKSLRPQKQQQEDEWSDEDKEFLELTLSNLAELKDRYGEGYGKVGKCIDWLKSLQPQPIDVEAAIAYQDGYQKALVEFSQKHQEWTDDDINMIDWLIRCCEKEHEELCNDKYGHQDIVSDLKRDCRKKWDWLESLKDKAVPQEQWKPSKEQMDALNYVVNLMASSERPTENDLYYNILKSLRQQLKKLKA